MKITVRMSDGDAWDVTVADNGTGAACIFESHMGWHNIYRVVDLAVAHGMQLDDDDKATMATYATGDYEDPNIGEYAYDISDAAVRYLTDNVVTEGWSFDWHDGEFFLANAAWWEIEA